MNKIHRMDERIEKVYESCHFVELVNSIIRLFAANNALIKEFHIEKDKATIIFNSYDEFDNAREVYFMEYMELGKKCNHKTRINEEENKMTFFNYDHLGYKISIFKWSSVEESEDTYSLLVAKQLVKELNEEQRGRKDKGKRRYEISPVNLINNMIKEI